MATDSLPERGPGAAARPELEGRPGMRLGRYELLVPIASGGMAQVWVAQQHGEHGFKKLVALKTIRPDLAEASSFRRMFLDEARLASRIRHANVVEVQDLGEEGAIVFQAMTLVEGDSLQGLLRRWHRRGDAGGIPAPVAMRIVADAATGLHAAHELTDEDGVPMRLVHRDVSPQNILVGVDGVAKIADFGIAKALGRLADETEAGQVKGKFSYMAPEQVARMPPDRRSDVFSAGIVAWEALTGVRLFRGIDVLDTVARVQSMRIPDPRELAPDLPPAIASVVMRALARDPAERFATAAALADALEDAGRASAAIASTKEVAAFVTELTGADVEALRARTREVSRGGIVGSPPVPAVPSVGTFAATTIADSSPPRGRSTRGAWIAAGACAAAIVAVGAVVVPRVLGSPAIASPAPAPAPTPVPVPMPVPGSASTPALAPTLAPPASASASAPSPKPRARPRPATAPAPTLPFGNPYAP